MVATDVDDKSEPRSKTMLVLQPAFIILVEDSSNRFGYSDTHPGAQRSSHPAFPSLFPTPLHGQNGMQERVGGREHPLDLSLQAVEVTESAQEKGSNQGMAPSTHVQPLSPHLFLMQTF